MFSDAKWIGDTANDQNRSVYFRHAFTVNGQISKATLFIAALGLGVCELNGNKVTDEVLTTPFTRYDKRYVYREYDVTDFLNEGKNAIGVHVGNGFYSNNTVTWNDPGATWRDKVKLLACLRIDYANGKTDYVTTNRKDWFVRAGACLYNQMRQGEFYDAREACDGYSLPDYDMTDWHCASMAHEPGGIPVPMEIPPIRVIRTLESVSCQNGIYDFGENTSGWARIRLSGECGREVRMIYAERLTADGSDVDNVNINRFNPTGLLKHEDVFVCSGKGNEEYAPSFCYHGFRYIKVVNAPENFEIHVEVVHTDLQKIGSFTCNDPMLNLIHEASVRSTLTNYHGIPTDCPHREQNGWTGDAQLSAEQALINFEIKDAYRKYLFDIMDGQRDSGQLPGIAPTSNWGYSNGGPAWDSIIFILPWNVYVATGDRRMLEDAWGAMNLYFDYLERSADDYIVSFGLGDWCHPDATWQPETIRFTSTAFFYYDAVLMGKIARLLGHDGSRFDALAKEIKKAWRDAFLKDENLHKRQTFFACALYYGLLDGKEEEKWALDNLVHLICEDGGKFRCGILGIKYAFNVLSEHGYMDLVYEAVTSPECPSYAYWINQGLTTFCENWNAKNNSLNHHMFSEVDRWFYRYIGGIRLDEDGLRIKPLSLSAVTSFKASHRDIEVALENGIYTVTLPSCAEVIFGEKTYALKKGTYRFKDGFLLK